MTISIGAGGHPFYEGNPDGVVEAPVGQRVIEKGTGIIYQQVVSPSGRQWVAASGGAGDLPTKAAGTQLPFGTFNKIWVRETGSDIHGDGSMENPFRTLVRGVRNVPLISSPGERHVVDITGISETLPMNYELPPWKGGFSTDEVTGSASTGVNLAGGEFTFQYAVSIIATPRLVASISEADATISASDIRSQVALTGSGLFLLTLNTARASWANNALKGKFLFGSLLPETATIGESTSGSLLLLTPLGMTGTLYIKEPSAFLTSSQTVTPNVKGGFAARNFDSLCFAGIDFFSPQSATAGVFALEIGGPGSYALQHCKVQGGMLHAASQAGLNNRVLHSHLTGRFRIGGNTQIHSVYGNAFTNFNFVAGGNYSWRKCLFESSSVSPQVGLTIHPGGGNAIPGAVDNLHVQHVIIRAMPDGIRFHGARARLDNVDIYGCTRDAIRCESGSAYMELSEVRTAFGSAYGYVGSVNAGYGIRAFDGSACKVDDKTAQAATSQGQQLRGTLGEMRVGNKVARTFDDFISGTSGPALFEIDAHTSLSTGMMSGTLSRVYQQ